MVEQLRRVDRRPDRGHRADPRRHLHPRPLPARRRARPGQDADGSSIAQILAVAFKRIQFTPDLMPSDITGTTMLDENEPRASASSASSTGPIFANIVLADEINRTPPKTQAALLEAMQERQVTRRAGDAISCPNRSSSSPRRTRSNRKAPIRCPKPSSTASCSTSRSITRRSTRRSGSCRMSTRGDEPELTKVLTGKAIVACRSWSAACRWRLRHRLHREAGAGDAAERPDRAGLHQATGRLGRGSARGHLPGPGGPGVRRDGRPLQRRHRRRQEGRDPGAAAPRQHQLPGPGRRARPATTSSRSC